MVRPNNQVFGALMKNLDLADGELFPDQVSIKSDSNPDLTLIY